MSERSERTISAVSDGRTVASEVEVAVDPMTAFTAFTAEMDSWWVHGPINFYDQARAVAQRCEPGVGGRIVEVYEDGDPLVVADITAWEPGSLLGWHSGVDDVTVEVTFSPTATGTLVRVAATVPAGGADRGGTAWVGVTPRWFGEWCARRATTPAGPREIARVAVAVHYAKPATAARWLADAFGFAPAADLPDHEDPDGYQWIEFRIGDVAVMAFPLAGNLAEGQPATHVPWVFVDDLDAHLARATAAGATIVSPIRQHGYRCYEAADLEGHRWTFAQAPPLMRA